MLDISEYARVTKKNSPRPTDWSSIIGNARAKEQLREAITAARRDQRPLPHTLLFGPPGTGKSTISKVVAKSMGGGFLETTASTLEVPADMIRFLWRLNDLRLEAAVRERDVTQGSVSEADGAPSTIFIDEIHTLGQAKGRQSIDQESVFSLLEDWEFHHNLIGKPVDRMDGQRRWLTDTSILVWPFTAIGATNEPGLLSQPVLRRFLLHIELEPYTEAEIAQILLGACRRLELTITEEAAVSLSKYSRRNPGTANGLIERARARATATNRAIIDNDVATEIVERMNLYSRGLNETDVRVLTALYDRAPKGMGMAEISRSVGISQSQFSGLVEPYLQLLGFMETQARRVIKPAGIKYLVEIGKIAQADVRPVLVS